MDLIEEGRSYRRCSREEPRPGCTRSAPISSLAPTDVIRSYRDRAGLIVEDFGAPIDVVWIRLSKERGTIRDGRSGSSTNGHVFVMLDRGEYWQCAFVIPKGGYDDLKARRARATARRRSPRTVLFLGDRVERAHDVGRREAPDRARSIVFANWYRNGLVCIGDAAHAMSPIGGVEINLAIQDAVAAAKHPDRPAETRPPRARGSEGVSGTTFIPDSCHAAATGARPGPCHRPHAQRRPPTSLPLVARLLRDHPVLRRLPARMIGLGFRPEHIGR